MRCVLAIDTDQNAIGNGATANVQDELRNKLYLCIFPNHIVLGVR
jgi:hypothetical protein